MNVKSQIADILKEDHHDPLLQAIRDQYPVDYGVNALLRFAESKPLQHREKYMKIAYAMRKGEFEWIRSLAPEGTRLRFTVEGFIHPVHYFDVFGAVSLDYLNDKRHFLERIKGWNY